jgi:hypothetical protein
MQRSLRFYEKNVYILNRKALKIQHWFFKKLASLKDLAIPLSRSSNQTTERQSTTPDGSPDIIQIRKRSPYKGSKILSSVSEKSTSSVGSSHV